MRVLMIAWEYPPHSVGGLGRHVAELAPCLAEQGVDLHIVTPLVGTAPATERPAAGVTVHRVAPDLSTHGHNDLVGSVQHRNGSLERAARALARQGRPFDLIHGHDWLTAYSSVALAHALDRPLVTTIHSLEHGRMQGHVHTDHSRAIDGTEAWLAKESWRTVTVSRFMAQHLQDVMGVPPSKIDVIYNGVTLPTTLPSDTERSVVRQRYAPNGEQLICYVGRLVHEKGVHTLVDALPQVRERVPHVKLVIAGTGPMADQLRHQAHALGIGEHVLFAGYISDDERNALLAAADVAVFPSMYEPFGIVALEAMSFGCPVVVSATGGLAEIVRPHETGIVAEPGNAGSLAWGILHTLEHPLWAAARVRNALDEIRTVYSWQRAAAQTVSVYEQVVLTWQHRTPSLLPRRATAGTTQRTPPAWGADIRA